MNNKVFKVLKSKIIEAPYPKLNVTRLELMKECD